MPTLKSAHIASYLINRTGLNSDRNFMQVISDLSCIQVDPLNVVARSHELSLYNRSKSFKRQDLYDALYDTHKLFEYWLQLYSIIPVAAFPYLHSSNEIPGERQHEQSASWHNQYYLEHKDQIALTRKFIEQNGPTSSKEIRHLPKGAAVHSWKGQPGQIALLEYLWNTGEISICFRKSNQKYYDLTSRVLPKTLTNKRIDPSKAYRYLLDSYFKYFGLLRTNKFFRSGRDRAEGLRQELKRQLTSGEVTQVSIKNEETQVTSPLKYFIKSADLDLVSRTKEETHIGLNILPPLDPLILDREMTVDVFGFFYRWEAYTPARKRKFGYYNMPVLFNGKLVGQVDLAKDSANKKLIRRGSFLNSKSKQLQVELEEEIQRLEHFCFE